MVLFEIFDLLDQCWYLFPVWDWIRVENVRIDCKLIGLDLCLLTDDFLWDELLRLEDLWVGVETETFLWVVIDGLLELVDVVLEGLSVNGLNKDLSEELFFVGFQLGPFQSYVVEAFEVSVFFEFFFKRVETSSGVRPTGDLS